jgi:hypothetical protein
VSSSGTARRRAAGVVERVTQDYDTELESRTRGRSTRRPALRHAERAARELDASCYSFAHGGAASLVRRAEGVYCISSMITIATTRPAPAHRYVFLVGDRARDRSCCACTSATSGSSKSAKNRIIAEIANGSAKLRRRERRFKE